MPLNTTQKVKVALLITCIVALGALAYSYLTALPAESCEEKWGDLSVSVEDKYGNHLRNANVSLWWRDTRLGSGLTDNEGEYKFKHILYGDSYNLTVDKKGCQLKFSYFYFDKNHRDKAFSLPYLNFTLILNITEAGVGQPVVNATVQIYRYNYLEAYQEAFFHSNNTGMVCIPALEYDEYALVITHPAYFSYTALLFADADKGLVISLQKIPTEPPEPPIPEFDLMDLAIGMAAGFIVAVAVLWVYLLQRKAREESSSGKITVKVISEEEDVDG